MEMPGYVFTVSQETRLFLMSCLLGLPLGLCFDCFRFLRTLLPHHRTAVFLEDALFAVGFVLLWQGYAVSAAGGSLRYYYALGALLGFALYLLTVGAVTKRMMQRIRQIRRRTCDLFGKCFRRICQFLRLKTVLHRKKYSRTEKMPETT